MLVHIVVVAVVFAAAAVVVVVVVVAAAAVVLVIVPIVAFVSGDGDGAVFISFVLLRSQLKIILYFWRN